MSNFAVPTRDQVAPANQTIFDNLQGKLGFVPNLYATLALSDTALGNYLQFQGGKTSLSNKEKEVVNLVVSQINDCDYCQAAHTAIGKMNGFSESEILELRGGTASFNQKYDALVKLAAEVTRSKGRPSETVLNNFFEAGYTKGTLVDVVIAIADKVVMNYVHNITQVPVDFPAAPALDAVPA